MIYSSAQSGTTAQVISGAAQPGQHRLVHKRRGHLQCRAPASTYALSTALVNHAEGTVSSAADAQQSPPSGYGDEDTISPAKRFTLPHALPARARTRSWGRQYRIGSSVGIGIGSVI